MLNKMQTSLHKFPFNEKHKQKNQQWNKWMEEKSKEFIRKSMHCRNNKEGEQKLAD